MTSLTNSPIKEFFSNKCVLLTGASGFIGKQVLEKLLRSIDEISSIYILMRKNKKHSALERCHLLLQIPLYKRVAESTNIMNKIIVVEGDILLPKLGITDDLLYNEITTKVSIVFHLAATISFNEPIRMAVNMNIIGLQKMLDLCDNIVNLQALVHVSTAYSNCTQPQIEEKVYPAPVSHEKLINAIDWLPDDVLNLISKKMVGKHPNTYTFTKAIAEEMLMQRKTKYPIAIFRPSIVTAAHTEPIPGWVDNLNGATGVLTAIGTGFVKAVYGESSMIADLVPVDLVANAIISVAWATATDTNQKEPKCYNCTTGSINAIRWNTLGTCITNSFHKYPMENPIRVPEGWVTSNRISFLFFSKFSTYMRLLAVEFFRKSFTNNKRNLLKIYGNCQHLLGVMEYFTSNEWKWSNDNLLTVMAAMSEHDQKVFSFDPKQIDWPKYFDSYCFGIRKYVLHQNPSSIPLTRRILNRIYIVQKLLQCFLIIAFFHFLIRRSTGLTKLWQFAINFFTRFVQHMPFAIRA